VVSAIEHLGEGKTALRLSSVKDIREWNNKEIKKNPTTEEEEKRSDRSAYCGDRESDSGKARCKEEKVKRGEANLKKKKDFD